MALKKALSRQILKNILTKNFVVNMKMTFSYLEQRNILFNNYNIGRTAKSELGWNGQI